MIRVLLFIICFFLVGCKNESDFELSFEPIDYNENIIFFEDVKYRKENKILAIDTLNNRKLYVYDFKDNELQWVKFDPNISNEVFFLLNSDNIFYVLDPLSGKIKQYEINYPIADLTFVDKKVQVVRNIVWSNRMR